MQRTVCTCERVQGLGGGGSCSEVDTQFCFCFCWPLCAVAQHLPASAAGPHLGGVHDLLADVHFAEVLEEAQERDVEALPGVLPHPCSVCPCIYNLQQPEHPRRQVPVDGLLHAAVTAAASGRADEWPLQVKHYGNVLERVWD